MTRSPVGPRRLLVVDDEEPVRKSLTRILEKAGYECEAAAEAAEAREKIGLGFFEVVLCDMQMPGESGMDLLRQIANERGDTAIVMVTGKDDPEIARQAIDLGAYGYVVKPFTPNEILITVMNALRRVDLERARRIHAVELETKLTNRNHSLSQAIGRLNTTKDASQVPPRETLDRLTRALALKDEETGRHIERVGLYSELLAGKLLSGNTESVTWAPAEMRQASMLHDVGKIGIPDAILTKPGPLSPDERTSMQRHCELGYQLLVGSQSPLLDLAASIAFTHHERWDGSGYPRSLSGEEIPLEGRIVAVADVLDGLTSRRVYRPAAPMEEAIAEMDRNSGTAFCPRLIDLLLNSLSEIIKIRDEHPESELGPDQIRVLVVDDQKLFARGLQLQLEGSDDISVVGTATSIEEAAQVATEVAADVVVLDWSLPDGTGAEAAHKLLATQQSLKIVVLTGLEYESVLAEAVEAGCAAVLTKGRAFDEIVDAIRGAHAGETTIPLSKLSAIVERSRSPRVTAGVDLTAREMEVLARLGEGLSNEAIAELLSLSLHTVRNHVQKIITKMGAHSKLEAVTKGLRMGIIKFPSRFRAE
jgi:putative two-component system response regulator